MSSESTPREPLRALIAGAGAMGRWHALAARWGGATVVGVCDLDLDAARDLARGASVGTELGALVEATAPDVVHLCTPPDTHRELAERALRAGANVVAEKPLAETAADTEAVLRLASLLGRTVCPVHQLAFQPWLPRVTEVGELVAIEFAACSAGADGRPEAAAERIVHEILPHPLSLFERIQPGCLDAATWVAERARRSELRAQTVASGVSLALWISMRSRPTRNELVVSGTRGTLHADLFHGFATVERGRATRAYKMARPFAHHGAAWTGALANLARRGLSRETAYPGLRALVRAVYAEIRSDGPPALTPSHSLAVANARDAIRKVAFGSAGGAEEGAA